MRACVRVWEGGWGHLGEVHRGVEVVVGKPAVLLRVQQLQQRAGRVALVPWAPPARPPLADPGRIPLTRTRPREYANQEGNRAAGTRTAGRYVRGQLREAFFPLLLFLLLESSFSAGLDNIGPAALILFICQRERQMLFRMHSQGRGGGRGALPLPSLSISSIRIKGLEVAVLFRHWMTFPGIAPT